MLFYTATNRETYAALSSKYMYEREVKPALERLQLNALISGHRPAS